MERVHVIMFTRIYNNYTTNYNVEKGGTLLQFVVPDKESAEKFAEALKRQPVDVKSIDDLESQAEPNSP